MANFYNAVIPRPAGVPPTVALRIFAERTDGEDLTADDLAALRAVYPAAAVEARAEQPLKATKPKASTKPRKPAAKRAAAKRPPR